MGQELTARTRYRGLVKKRLLPVTIDGPDSVAEDGGRIEEFPSGAGIQNAIQQLIEF